MDGFSLMKVHKNFCSRSNLDIIIYAVKAQTSLAPLSRFRGSLTRYYCACTPMLYISGLCEDCAIANEIDYEIDNA